MEELITEIDGIESNQYLTFRLGTELYALAISKVYEVLEYTRITKVPRMPEFLKGVINLRGNVVPVINFRQILGMEAIEVTLDTCIIIAEIEMDNETVQLGALADSVDEVAEIDPQDIRPPMKLGTRLDTEFIRGMGKKGEDFIIILDIDKILNSSDIEMLKSASELDSKPIESVDLQLD